MAGWHLEPVDVVIVVTGSRLKAPYLAPLGALDADGHALLRQGMSQTLLTPA